ncbi:MAG: LLM class flavin-dependent oxidoreductase [Ilumatobacteraceae bacterium]
MFKFDMLFEISVPRPWEQGKEQRRFHEALDQAVFAEEMHFDTVWVVEHHFLTELAHSSAPDAWLGALAARTDRIRLGFGVTLLPSQVNHPIRVAERMATADIVSNGRLEVGTGRSSSPYQLEAFGVDVGTTREQWEESIKLLPRLWTEEDVTYEGRFWNWSDKVTVVPRPVQQPHPPLWVASTQPDTCRLAGEKGVGLLMTGIRAPELLAENIAVYKAASEQPIDQVGMFQNNQAALFTIGFCNEDDDKARLLGGQGGQWYVNRVNEIYKNDWRGTPLEAVPDSYRYHAKARSAGGGGNWATSLTARPINDIIDSGAFCVGDPASIIEKIKVYVETGADRLVCVMQMADIRHEDQMRSIELMGQEVIPAIRAWEQQRSVAQPVGGSA